MMPIDWDRVLGKEIRGKGDAPKFTDSQIADAVKAVKAFPAAKGDPNQIQTFWPAPKKMPDVGMVDFGDVVADTVNLKNLMSSNKYLKRDRLLWHVRNPGKALHDNPFTERPLCCSTDEGSIIIDGHHRIAALQLLGAKDAQVYNLPMN